MLSEEKRDGLTLRFVSLVMRDGNPTTVVSVPRGLQFISERVELSVAMP